MPRKVLLILAIIWAVLLGGGLAVALAIPATTSVSLMATRSDPSDPWTWKGEPIVIEKTNSGNKISAYCDVRPQSGEPRTIEVTRYEKRYAPQEVKPWFSGSAEITCKESVRVYSGLAKDLHAFSRNQVMMFIAFAIAFGPLLLVFAFARK